MMIVSSSELRSGIKLARLGAAYRMLEQISEALQGDDMPPVVHYTIVAAMLDVESEIRRTLVARTKPQPSFH
jgi:hypothetical protein